MYEMTYESASGLDASHVAANNLFFFRHWGAFLLFKTATYWDRLFHDGTIKSTSLDNLGIWRSICPIAGAEGYLYAWIYLTDNYYETYAVSGSINTSKLAATFAWETALPNGANLMLDPYNDVLVIFYGTHYLRVYQLSTGALLRTIDLGDGSRYQSLAWAKTGIVIVGSNSDGKVSFVNYLTGVVETYGTIDPFVAMSFDCLLDVIAAIGTDYKLRIYCLTSIGSNLANPTASPGLAQGAASRLSVRLLDDADQPIAFRWVSWTLEGVSGPVLGSLTKLVSQTDQDGYAYNTYVGPSSGTGQVRVTCEVDI